MNNTDFKRILVYPKRSIEKTN